MGKRNFTDLIENCLHDIFVSIADICRYGPGASIKIAVTLIVKEVNTIAMRYLWKFPFEISWKNIHTASLLLFL